MRILSRFFGIPFLDKVEEMLWEQARQRYVQQGRDPVTDAKAFKSAWKAWVKEQLAKEDEKLRPIWRESKNRLELTTEEALSQVFADSDQSWYSVEAGLSSYPDVIAVPLAVIRFKTQEVLPGVLAQKIEFRGLLPETRQGLAEFALERSFVKVVDRLRHNHQHLNVAGRLNPFVITDVIERDFYYLGSREDASRVDMMMLTAFGTAHGENDRRRHVQEKEAVARWVKELRKGRSESRRFDGTQWGIDQATLEQLTLGGVD